MHGLRGQQAIPHRATVNIDESLAKGFDRPWTTWRCLNRLRTGFTCSKEQRQRWRYYEGDTTCECGLATENTAHMMQCTLLEQPCSLDDLNKFNDTAKKCVEDGNTSLMTRRKRSNYKIDKHVYGEYKHNAECCLIGRQPGMAVRMPTPINQLFNDESIAVQIIFLDVYTWN